MDAASSAFEEDFLSMSSITSLDLLLFCCSFPN